MNRRVTLADYSHLLLDMNASGQQPVRKSSARCAVRPGMLVLFSGGAAAAAVLGSLFTPSSRGEAHDWYKSLKKAPYHPPEAMFPIVWTTLYALMVVSACRVARTATTGNRTYALSLWWLQLAANASWSPVFFGARNPRAALVNVGLLLPALVSYAFAATRVDRAAGWMMAPYLAWVGFAMAINAEIVRLNK